MSKIVYFCEKIYTWQYWRQSSISGLSLVKLVLNFLSWECF